MVVGGKLLALAYSATTTVTSTAATCFATLGSAAVGSTTFVEDLELGLMLLLVEVVVGKLVLDLLLLNRQDLLLGRLLLRLTQPCLSSLTAESTESPGSTEATTHSGSATGRYEYRHRTWQSL